ncbi:MAG: biopolymer transporter ExbD [Deltaproteobacteria bacterium]|nr:biopolymer transporter ExbD [Deltaproteobacteria bacterium]
MEGRVRSLIRRKARPPEHDPSDDGELNLTAYLDIVTNVIMFLLITVTTVMATVNINVSSPRTGGGGGSADEPEQNQLNLMVTITNSGHIVAGSGGVLTQGCERTGSPPTVPKRGSDWDWDGLTRCAEKIKSQFQNETRAVVAANPDIRYEAVVKTMDAIRGTEGHILFNDIMMSAGIQ